jgi:hypothetical protein
MASAILNRFFYLLLVALLFFMSFPVASAPPSTNCRRFPGDKWWPGAVNWASLNITVKGRLVKTVPIGTAAMIQSSTVLNAYRIKGQWDMPETQ